MLLRRVLFQMHWGLGVTAGLVLAVTGVTGAGLSFKDEILNALNRDLTVRVAERLAPLSSGDLVQRIQAQRPDAAITFLVLHEDPRDLSWVNLRAGGERETHYVNRTSGRLLGEGRGRAFFEALTRVHRWLALPGDGEGLGRRITGFAALSLIFFALSGLYLRWPRRPLDWRAWFVLDLRRSGRNLYRMLHAVVGGWVFLFYLLSATTGLYWSYDWYRDGVERVLVGEGAAAPRRPAVAAAPDLPRAWATFDRELGGRRYETLTIAVRSSGIIEFRGKLPGGRHDRVTDDLVVDAASGAPVRFSAYADRPLGQGLVTGVYELHRGAWFGWPGRIGVTIAALTLPLFTVTGLLLYVGRRRRKHTIGRVPPLKAAGPVSETGATIVAFASQTGRAERIARLTAQAIPGAVLTPLGALSPERLAAADRLFVIVSTYGEGEPPDTARSFARRMERRTEALPGLRYAILALGDREYPDFCAFGHRLDGWLREQGAQPLQPMICVDGDDSDALEAWRLFVRPDGAVTPDWTPEAMGRWRLVERQLLNPGSSGGPTWRVALEAVEPGTVWSAGDVIEIAPGSFRAESDGSDASTPRAYSIASLAMCGRVELLVRQVHKADGSLGLASGWLTDQAPIGGLIAARIRSNPGFHAPVDPAAPVILIGNGTGLAGLLAHVRHRATIVGGGPAWLLLGERHPDHDGYHAEDLAALVSGGTIVRLDRAWSRLPGAPRYVQDIVKREGEEVARWVASGAVIMVCGGAIGMASAVDETLSKALGETKLDHLIRAGRYRRDVY